MCGNKMSTRTFPASCFKLCWASRNTDGLLTPGIPDKPYDSLLLDNTRLLLNNHIHALRTGRRFLCRAAWQQWPCSRLLHRYIPSLIDYFQPGELNAGHEQLLDVRNLFLPRALKWHDTLCQMSLATRRYLMRHISPWTFPFAGRGELRGTTKKLLTPKV